MFRRIRASLKRKRIQDKVTASANAVEALATKIKNALAGKRNGRPRYAGSAQTHPTEPKAELSICAQQHSRLFTLPVEVRLMIYEEVLHLPAGDEEGPRFGVQIVWKRASDPPTVLSLLQTCKRIELEARTIFFSRNRLYIPRISIHDLKPLPPARAVAVTKLTILVHDAHSVSNALLRVSRHFPNINSIWLLAVGDLEKIFNLNEFSSWAPLLILAINQFRDPNIQVRFIQRNGSPSVLAEQALNQRVVEMAKQNRVRMDHDRAVGGLHAAWVDEIAHWFLSSP